VKIDVCFCNSLAVGLDMAPVFFDLSAIRLDYIDIFLI